MWVTLTRPGLQWGWIAEGGTLPGTLAPPLPEVLVLGYPGESQQGSEEVTFCPESFSPALTCQVAQPQWLRVAPRATVPQFSQPG